MVGIASVFEKEIRRVASQFATQWHGLLTQRFTHFHCVQKRKQQLRCSIAICDADKWLQDDHFSRNMTFPVTEDVGPNISV